MALPASPSTVARGIRLRRPRLRNAAFAAGAVCAGLLLLAVGEIYLRFFPPRDLHRFLGDASPLVGPFQPDAGLTVRYRSWEHFRSEYADRLAIYEPLFVMERPPPVWAFFGNSFVQAPGMLGDTVRDGVPNRVMFYLGRNEPIQVRFAQIALLLERGLRPERIFIVLLPLDFAAFAEHGLDQVHVNSRGAITHRPKLPPGALGSLVESSRLALSAWVRTRWHKAMPSYRFERTDPPLQGNMLADYRRLLGALRSTTEPRGVPVTIILLPNYEQITKSASFALQDQAAAVAREFGFDVCDPRDAFLAHPPNRRAELFIPDKHFSPLGNRLLLEALLAHLRSIHADPRTLDGGDPRR